MLARIPLLFEKNAGQVDSRVAFLARTPAYSLFLTSDTATLVLDPGTPRRSATDSDIFPVATTRRGHVVRMRLAGASADVDIAGADARAARMHYAAGRDAKTWRTDVPTYGRVEYSGIYPGIDLVYYGHDGRLEYDFVIAPGASPSRIALDFDGVQRVTVNSAGDLVLDTRAGRLVQAKPVAYQEIAGERHEVDSAYVRTGPRSVGFRVGAYDTSAPLRIDPVLAYSTYLGGGGGGQAYGVAADAAGNVYLCGTGNSTSFPVTGNGVPLDDDMFVVKLTPDGQVGYTFTMAGNASDSAEGLAVDASGQVAVTGYSDSSNLPLMNAFLGDQPLRDSYVVKLNPDGNILFMTYIGGSLSDTGETVTFDPFGNIYAAGTTTSTDFPMLNALRSTSAALEGCDRQVRSVGQLALLDVSRWLELGGGRKPAGRRGGVPLRGRLDEVHGLSGAARGTEEAGVGGRVHREAHARGECARLLAPHWREQHRTRIRGGARRHRWRLRRRPYRVHELPSRRLVPG